MKKYQNLQAKRTVKRVAKNGVVQPVILWHTPIALNA